MSLYIEKKLNKKINNVHFIGIGGTSMSGLALILMKHGINITGSDIKHSSYTEKLVNKGVQINIGHKKSNIQSNCDLVVYSAAIHEDNPEMVRSKELNIPLMERSDFLGALTKDFSKTIAVAGTHGKTTTSSLISLLLYKASLDPTISIGGTLDAVGGNARVGNSDFFVTEACEYVDSFLKSSHFIGTILNIEEDHLDYFRDIDHIKDSFHKFAKIIPKEGLLIANGDDPNIRDVFRDLNCNIITYGINTDNDWYARNIQYDSLGKPTFEVMRNNKLIDTFKLNIPGEHNVLNSIAVIICGYFLGVDNKIIKETLAEFNGPHRRFEFRGKVNDILVYEDYAHHPTELKVTIDACKNYPHKKLWVVFQPHTYSRTYAFFDDFVNAFEKADFAIINDIYSKREENLWNITSEDLATAIHERLDIPSRSISSFNDIVNFLVDNVEKGDFVLVAGSQTINEVAFNLVENLKNQQ